MKDKLKLLGSKQVFTLNELAEKLGLKYDYLSSKVEELSLKAIVKKEIKIKEVITPGEKLLAGERLPESTLLEMIEDIGEIKLDDLRKKSGIPSDDFNAGLAVLLRLGIIKTFKGDGERRVKIHNLSNKKEVLASEKILRMVREKKRLDLSNLSKEERRVVEKILKRPGYLKKSMEKIIYVKLLKDPKIFLDSLIVGEEITQLTPSIIREGSWRGKRFKSYDLAMETFKSYPGRIHPLRELIREVREVFLSLGFREEFGPLIEVAFINFDMLFQPQDHPAREMQDTFYLKNPKYMEIPYEELIEKIKRTHEDGWITGSKGWGYKWSTLEAKRLVLRTHTTSVTVKALYETGEKPDKIFTIGNVFRNETVDYKHLVEFMQVDGIVIHPKANLRWLMGIIEYFYRRMGFKKVKFWPSYFPYTEPSLQPSIYVEKWDKWLELGGAGIFRPEVTIPLGVKWPVLAWGLGLERLLMIKYELDDIRTIYKNDIGWLRKALVIV